MNRGGRVPGRILRAVAWLLIRGREARYVRADLEELAARDAARGVSPVRVRWRYARNMLSSSYALSRAQLAMPRLRGISLLDVKLGIRMLGKQPGLTLVSGFALALGIPIALAPFQLMNAFNQPLPVDEGHRVVGLRNRDVARSNSEYGSIHEFEGWRLELRSFSAMAAVTSDPHNVMTEDGRSESVRGSEMTASGFEVLRTRPLLGRVLLAADETPGAHPVVVISYDLWQTRFGAADVLGQWVRIGDTRRMVVGVMPQGFLFPYRDHLWLPFRARAADYDWGSGPEIWIFGRLADVIGIERARAELAPIGLRTAADHPETHEHFRPEVVPVTWAFTGMRASFAQAMPAQLIALLLLAVACGNVGTLTLARTASRSSEIAVRSAIGASRSRIISQLFIEALVLSSIAAAVGLLLGNLLTGRLQLLTNSMPYWWSLQVRPSTIALAAGLAVFCAVLAGVIPALKATGRGVYGTLQRTAAGVSGVRFGIVSTVLIVVEVALSVGFLSAVVVISRNIFHDTSSEYGIPVDEYLAVQIRLPSHVPASGQAETNQAAFEARLAHLQEEVARRVESRAGIRGVAFASTLPGMDHSRRLLEVEGADPVAGEHGVRWALVDIQYFEGLDQPILSGRRFTTGDLHDDARAVIVNQSFVEGVLRGANPIGRRVRWAARSQSDENPWLEIVGVVPDLGMNVVNPDEAAGIYQPVSPGKLHPLRMAIHVGVDPSAFAPTVRSIVTETDPTALLSNPQPLGEVFSMARWGARWGGFAFALLSTIAIVLSAAGLWALMSFTVSQRTREIGIRTALGAQPDRIMRVIARRAAIQIGAGVIHGAFVGWALITELRGEEIARDTPWPIVLGIVASIMIGVGLLACAGPTRRGLRIQPIQALREGA